MNSRSTVLAAIVPLCVSLGDAGAISFENATSEAGLSATGISFGASWGDADGDGRPDLWVSNHGQPSRLYVNDGGRFSGATDRLGDLGGDQHGAAWADFDRDGRQDLLQLLGAERGEGGQANQLCVQGVDGFTEEAAALGLDYPLGRGRTPLWLDWNGDGRLDVLITNFLRSDGQAPSALFTQRRGAFTDNSRKVGLATTQHNAFAQLIRLEQPHTPAVLIGAVDDWPDRIYGFGPTGFSDLTDSLGLGPLTSVQDSVVADFDNDRRADVFAIRAKGNYSAAAMNGPGRVRAVLHARHDENGVRFRATGDVTVRVGPASGSLAETDLHVGKRGEGPAPVRADGSYVVTLSAADPGVRGIAPHTPGTDHGFYVGYSPNRDEWTALLSSGKAKAELILESGSIDNLTTVGFSSSRGALPDTLYLQGTEGFTAAGAGAGLDASTASRSVVAADFDNDGDLDLYLACASSVENLENVLYENDGSGRFTRVPGAGGAAGSSRGVAESVAAADYDLDGFVDLFVTNGEGPGFLGGGPQQLFRNRGNGKHWVQIDLEGTDSNRDGIGSRVQVRTGNRTQIRDQDGGMHRHAQNHARVHFGLGGAATIDQIRIEWPSGRVDRHNNVRADRIYRAKEGGRLRDTGLTGRAAGGR